jgi:hypothetical protein
LCGFVRAQDFPQAEVFGGYSYLNVDVQSGVPSSSPISRQSANGWEASAAFNVNPWLGIEGDFGGYYKSVSLGAGIPDLNTHTYSFTGGPRFNYRQNAGTAFVHALVGGDSLTGSVSGVGSASQNSFALAVGGGVEWKVKPRSHWGIRGSADYVLTKHNIIQKLESGVDSSLSQNNFRASFGVFYQFGVREPNSRPQKADSDKHGCAGSSESPLLGIIGCSDDQGVIVSKVQYGSPASRAGLSLGDIITSIDGRPVRSNRDIELAIGASATGTVKLEYLLRGSYLTVREVKTR